MVIQLAPLEADQPQPVPAVTPTLPLLPAEERETLPGEIVYVQASEPAPWETDKLTFPDTPLKPSTPIAYLVPATALNVTLLVKVPPEGESSLAATELREETEEPVNTPMIVSKLLPRVEIVTLPEAGAVQNHQTEAPPMLPALGGSPASLVAPTLEPAVVTVEPLRIVALAKLSLTGAACNEAARPKVPMNAKNGSSG